MAEEEAVGSAGRSPPERAREDDRVGLLGATEAGRSGLDTARVVGADRRCSTPRLLGGGRAPTRGGARRPLRTGAPRFAGARAAAQGAARMTRVAVCLPTFNEAENVGA